MELYFLIGALGLVTGFLSGLVGIGGGIVLAPLLLYVPPLFAYAPLSIKAVAGLTIVQGLLGCLSGALAHHRFKFVSGPLSLWMGVSITLAAAIGGAGSSYVPDRILLVIFAALALTASLLIFFPARGDAETHDTKQLNFSRFRAITSATGVGFFGGLVGQGGSFILIPLMTAFVHMLLEEDPPGGAAFSAGGSVDYSVTYDYDVIAVPGDINGDGVVNVTDFLELLSAWGTCQAPCPPTCPADLDGDCTVGILDFLQLLANWT